MIWNKKKVFGLLLILPAILVVAWWVFFDFGIKHLQDRVKDFTSDMRKRGYEVSYDDFQVTGNPFSITGTFKNVKFKEKNNLYQLAGPEVTASFAPWNYREITASLNGKHKLEVPGLSGMDLAHLSLQGTKATFFLDNKHKADQIHIIADKITPLAGGAPLPIAFHVVNGKFTDLVSPLSSSGDVSLKLSGVDQVLGIKKVDHPLTFKLNYTLKGLPPSAKLKTLGEWRDMGGALEINHIEVDWEILAIKGEGTLALDEKMRPLGAMTASFEGYDNTLRLLVKAGYVKKKAAKAIEFALQLIAGEPALGKKNINMPVTLQNGHVKIGPAKLMKLKPLAVPEKDKSLVKF